MGNGCIKAIIFDLGNVLIDFDYRIAVSRISHFTDKQPRQIYGLFFDSAVTGLFEEGKISPADFFRWVKQALNLKIGFEKFLPIWNEIFFLSERNQAVYRLAKILKGRYRLALVSNINILHFEHVRKAFPVFDIFSAIITSFETGLRKPHPLIYQKTLAALGVSSADVFYIDDRQDLVNEARGLGIRGSVFTEVGQLKNDLLDNSVILN